MTDIDFLHSLSKRKRRPVEVPLSVILPRGSSFAYSVNKNQQLTGLKISQFSSLSVDEAKFFTWLYKQSALRRVVLFDWKQRLKMPPGVSNLKELRLGIFQCVESFPEDLLNHNSPIYLDSTESDVAKFLDLVNPKIHSEAPNVFIKNNNQRMSKRRLDELHDDLHLADLIAKDPKLSEICEELRGFYFPSQIKDPPPEIVQQGKTALTSYFSSVQQSSVNLHEAKLLLVGHGGSGKTSIIKSILREPFDPSERQTHGINIRPITLRWAKNRTINLKSWDFGGQEIMHATHQFFLSRRSVYIIVLDGRKDDHTEYWLKHVQAFGGDAPCIIVLNKSDENPGYDVNRRFLRKKYPNIIGFVRTSCKSSEGLLKLKRLIREAAGKVEIIQTKWPEKWLRVKEAIENTPCDFIDIQAFSELCIHHGIDSRPDQETLAQFLHDLGSAVHFSELELYDTYVLNPRWLTAGVYAVINSEVLARERGVLSRQGFSECLIKNNAEIYPRERHSYILEIMKKFELCFELDIGGILVPDLLPVAEPDFELDDSEESQLIYQYRDVVPRSVIPRIIVRLHDIVHGSLLWRTGVVLHDPSSQAFAVLRADYDARTVAVSVTGSSRRDFLAVIRSEFRHVHRRFAQLDVRERLPLPDSPTVLVSYDHLIKLEQRGQATVLPDGADHDYIVSDLLGSVRVPNRWSEEEFISLLKLAIADTDDEKTTLQLANDIVQLQPNIAGVGLNLNALLERFLSWREKSSASSKTLPAP